MKQWLQFFSHLAFKETRDGRVIRMSLSDIKWNAAVIPFRSQWLVWENTSPCLTLRGFTPCTTTPPLEVWPVSSAFTWLWLCASCRLAPISTTAERVWPSALSRSCTTPPLFSWSTTPEPSTPMEPSVWRNVHVSLLQNALLHASKQLHVDIVTVTLDCNNKDAHYDAHN